MAAPSTAPRAAHPATPRPGFKSEPHAVQHAWLQAHLGQALALRLVDGKVLRGALLAWDTYTLTVRLGDGQALVFKQALAYLAPASSVAAGA